MPLTWRRTIRDCDRWYDPRFSLRHFEKYAVAFSFLRYVGCPCMKMQRSKSPSLPNTPPPKKKMLEREHETKDYVNKDHMACALQKNKQASNKSIRDIRDKAVARVIREAYTAGSVLSNHCALYLHTFQHFIFGYNFSCQNDVAGQLRASRTCIFPRPRDCHLCIARVILFLFIITK